MTRETYLKYEAYMTSCMRDSAHDTGHIFRVLHAALLLAQREKQVDFDVLIAAALLHDIGREEQFRTGESHAAVGARMARAYLLEQGEAEAFAQHVSDCIRTHSFRKNDPPVSMEAKLIYEADKLDVVGVIGVARTFLYQGRMGEPIYSVGPDGEVLGGDEKEPSFYSEYRHKLMRLPGRFLTAQGKRLASARSERSARFEAALRAEVAISESGAGWRYLPRAATAAQRRVFNIAQMLAEGSGKADREVQMKIILGEEACSEAGIVGRSVLDAQVLEGEGALGIARRLMEIGRRRERMERIFDEEPQSALHTAQARGIARTRRETAKEYLDNLRTEMEEYRTDAEAILAEILK